MGHDHAPSRHPVRILTVTVAALALAGVAVGAAPARAADGVRGHDVSSHQKEVDWDKARDAGARFVYVKATESHTYKNPHFRQQYDGARSVGIIRGAYHFALPNKSSGQEQAAFFVRNGGWWKGDGWTLPPALDIEHNPYGKDLCYGLGKERMVAWIRSFSDEVKRQTGRHPVIYTSTLWWNRCTGGHGGFGADHPLWLARHSASPGPMPAGWKFPTIWQHADSGPLPGDQNLFNGSMDQLRRFTTS